MSRYLLEYLKTVDGSFACIPRYESSLGENSSNCDWLCGHYQALLSDLVSAIGREELLRFVAAREEIFAKLLQAPRSADFLSQALNEGDGVYRP